MKLLIPMAFQNERPHLTKAILAECKTQAQADKYLAKFIPGYRRGYEANSREARRNREANHEAQAAGSYSLGACQGGAEYHATPWHQHKHRESMINAPTIAGAVVHGVPEVAPVQTPAFKRPPVQMCAERPLMPPPVLTVEQEIAAGIEVTIG